MADRLTRALTSARTAWLIIVAALLLSGLALAAGPVERTPARTDPLPLGSDSRAAAELTEQLPRSDASTAVVLFTAESGRLTPDQTRRIGELAQALRRDMSSDPGGAGTSGSSTNDSAPDDTSTSSGTTSSTSTATTSTPTSATTSGSTDAATAAPPSTTPASTPAGAPPVIPSEDGTAAIAVIPVDAPSATEAAGAVTELRAALRADVPDGVTAQVTGPAAVQADLAEVFEGADLRLLGATAAVVAVLLIVTYRSPVLWIFPLAVIGIGDRVAAVVATRVLDATGTVWDESTTGILSVLVFGAGTNYALLLISRYRDELRLTADRRLALRRALGRTAHAVLTSATTVIVGVLTLMLSAFPSTRGLGLACAIGIALAVLYALVVLPAVLSYLGRWVFWPRVPHEGETTLSEGRSLWRRVGDAVAARPLAYVGGCLAVLALAAAGLTQVYLGLAEAEQFIETPESLSAAQRLGESFPAGSGSPTTVVTKGDPVSAEDVQRAVEGVSGVASVQPAGRSDDGAITALSLILDDGPETDAAQQTVRDLRAAVAPYPGTHVGGSTAEELDADAASADDRARIIPLALGLVLLVLAGLLRSVAAPVILVATVVATYLASLGLSWWIFTEVFGFSALASNGPLFAFLFLVALGVDYNIFLVTRAREEARSHGAREGMLRALAATGGVITSAGILLAAVFAVLGVLPLVVLAQLGTIVCVGVLLDTLLVRTVLVPAIALLLGDRFWWPRRAAG